jgi:hypothetical protein
LGHTFTGNYITPMSADLRHTLPENIFQIIFDKSPGSLLVKADLPRFTIVAASDTYLAVTNTIREAILGKSFSQVFPDADGPDEKQKHRTYLQKWLKPVKRLTSRVTALIFIIPLQKLTMSITGRAVMCR